MSDQSTERQFCWSGAECATCTQRVVEASLALAQCKVGKSMGHCVARSRPSCATMTKGAHSLNVCHRCSPLRDIIAMRLMVISGRSNASDFSGASVKVGGASVEILM